jgi:predicted SAM-dependent methyltransferase
MEGAADEYGLPRVKINLGCGRRRMPGFVNVDFQGEPDVRADVFGRLPFEDGCAEEVHAIHVAEHVHRWRIAEVLKEWTRLLALGGLLVLEMPCLDKVLGIFFDHIQEGKPVPVNLTMWGLYGDPGWKDPAMCHHWCYSISEMKALMEGAGLTVEVKEAQTHQPIRDMRLEGRWNATSMS